MEIIRLIDLTGNIVMQQNIVRINNQIDLSRQAAGNYIITVEVNDEKSEVAVIKVQ